MAYFGGDTTARPWPRVEFVTLSLWVVSICLAAVAVYFMLGSGKLSGGEEKAALNPEAIATGPEAEILVAKQTVLPGQKIEASMLKTEKRPVEGMQALVVQDFEAISGGYASGIISEGTPIYSNQISMTPKEDLFTSKIPPGYRAVSIRVDAESGVEGWARPGASVDVVWSTAHRGKDVVTIIVDRAIVLSAGQSTMRSPGAPTDPNTKSQGIPSHVTLLVSSDDAQKVQMAKNSGALSLNLRGDFDNTSAGSGTLTVARLLKASGLEPIGEMQGSIEIDGRQFVMKQGRLMSAAEADKLLE